MARRSGGESTQQPCMPCTGRGTIACRVCGGAGATVLSKTRLAAGGRLEFYHDRVACTSCFGTGRVTCLSCRGVGWVLARKASSA
jgi:DnaJ-class molecular chaperone